MLKTAHSLEVDYFFKTLFSSQDVVQVNIAAATGDMGILANHVPSIEPLRPGVVEVVESGNSSQKWFGMFKSKAMLRDLSTNIYLLRFTVSGGFATVHPNNKLTINAVEAAPLEDFSLEVRILIFIQWWVLTICVGYSCQPGRIAEDC